ncbi:MAG TPA: hypothetical protein PKE69_01890 [Pyrinomonadaceae bacterium]|nr:hypothetical protein [Pyrinomonadaceae bacterium]
MKLQITRKTIIVGLGLTILFGIAIIYKEKSSLLFKEDKVLASSNNNLLSDVQILYKTRALEVVPVFSRNTESSFVVELSITNISKYWDEINL